MNNLDEDLRAFEDHHSLDLSRLPDEELSAVRAALACRGSLAAGFKTLPAAVMEDDPTVGFMWQLYERCTERVRGALVAFATGCPAASEIIARATIEACVTFRYILGDARPRLAAFFRNHIEQGEKQESLWRKSANQLLGDDRRIHLIACGYRREGIEAMRSIVDDLVTQLVGTDEPLRWPSVAARFDATGDSMDYRTMYSRLCSEPHLDAEETLRYFVGQVSGKEVLEALAAETIAFTRMMVLAAVAFYAQAGRAYADVYQMTEAMEVCDSAERQMFQYSAKVSDHAGGLPG